jgi:hypothetical protein
LRFPISSEARSVLAQVGFGHDAHARSALGGQRSASLDFTQRLNAQPIGQAASLPRRLRPFNNFEVAVSDGVVTIAEDARSYRASALCIVENTPGVRHGWDAIDVVPLPRPQIVVGGGIRFRFFVTIGDFVRPWGWDIGPLIGFARGDHRQRTLAADLMYVHPYGSGGTDTFVCAPLHTRNTVG